MSEFYTLRTLANGERILVRPDSWAFRERPKEIFTRRADVTRGTYAGDLAEVILDSLHIPHMIEVYESDKVYGFKCPLCGRNNHWRKFRRSGKCRGCESGPFPCETIEATWAHSSFAMWDNDHWRISLGMDATAGRKPRLMGVLRNIGVAKSFIDLVDQGADPKHWVTHAVVCKVLAPVVYCHVTGTNPERFSIGSFTAFQERLFIRIIRNLQMEYLHLLQGWVMGLAQMQAHHEVKEQPKMSAAQRILNQAQQEAAAESRPLTAAQRILLAAQEAEAPRLPDGPTANDRPVNQGTLKAEQSEMARLFNVNNPETATIMPEIRITRKDVDAANENVVQLTMDDIEAAPVREAIITVGDPNPDDVAATHNLVGKRVTVHIVPGIRVDGTLNHFPDVEPPKFRAGIQWFTEAQINRVDENHIWFYDEVR